MYIKNSWKIRDKIEVEKHYSGNFGAPGIKREPKKKKTPEEVARQNLWRKNRDLRRTIELNFVPGDWHVTLTCRTDDRPDKEAAPTIIRAFRDRLRAAYKKQKWELKYIITTETGERGAVHWHMIINDTSNNVVSTAKLIRKLWTMGRCYFVPLDDSGDYKKLAEYIVKETSRKIEQEETIEKLSYMASRNLIKPEVVKKKKEVRASAWSKKPKAQKGWEVILESVVNGRNKFTGLPYQYYTMRKVGSG